MENKHPNGLDYEVMKQKLREQFRTGKSLFSKGGAFAPLLEELLNSMLEGELDGHFRFRRVFISKIYFRLFISISTGFT